MLERNGNIYEILGIDRNADTKTIKKAYARLVKQYHPEENPEEWKRIHDAYELAMKNASVRKQYEQNAGTSKETYDQSQIPNISMSQAFDRSAEAFGEARASNMLLDMYEKEIPVHILSESQENELEAVFGNVEKVVREKQDEQEKVALAKIERELQAVRQMTKKRRLRVVDEWTRFFSRRNLLPIISRSEFLTGMGDCLASKTIDDAVYEYLSEQLERIIKYLKKNNPNPIEADSNMDAARYVRDRLISGNMVFRKKRGIVIKITMAVFAVFMFLQPLLEDKYSPQAQYQKYINTSHTVPEPEPVQPEHTYSDTEPVYTETEFVNPDVNPIDPDTDRTYPNTGLITLDGGQIAQSPEETKEMLQRMLEDGVISQEEYDSFILELEQSSAESQESPAEPQESEE